MTELPPRVQDRIDRAADRKARRRAVRAGMDAARAYGLAARKATRLARLGNPCADCGVPADANAHWWWCTRYTDTPGGAA